MDDIDDDIPGINDVVDLETGYRPLHVATLLDDQEGVKQLLQSSYIRINAQDMQGCTSLLHAVLHDFDVIAKLLLQHGAGMVPDNTGLTPWIASCMRGNETLVQLFLDQPDFDVDRIEDGNMTGIFVAASSGHAHVVQMLLAAGARLDIGAFFFNVTPLHTSVSMNHDDVVKCLLNSTKAKDVVDNKTVGGLTALHIASEENSFPNTQRLLECGADPWVLDNTGKTPFDLALERGNVQVAFLTKNAMLEPWRFFLLKNARKRGGCGEKNEKLGCTIAYVTGQMSDDLFLELEEFMLPLWFEGPARSGSHSK